MRGTKNKNRQQIQDETDRLKAQINVSGGVDSASASIRTLEANLADSLRFVRELLREPSFPEAEFEQIRQQRIASAESAKTEPNSLASLDLSRHLNARYPRGDVRYVVDARRADRGSEEGDARRRAPVLQRSSTAPARARSWSAASSIQRRCRNWSASCSAIGRAPAATSASPTRTPSWKPINRKIETPDKQNALFLVGDAHEDDRRRSRLRGAHHRRHGLRRFSQLAAVPAHSREGRSELRRIGGILDAHQRRRRQASRRRPSRRRRTCPKWRPPSTRNSPGR